MLKSDSIQTFLRNVAQPDLAELYSINMECQVNVLQLDGKRIEGDYKGKRWHGFTDDLTTWKPFRIPFGANKEPHYTDSDIRFDLAKYAEGIGMTGWDWKNKRSRWVAFDFDSIVGHADGLSNQELEEILNKTRELPWVTVRKSSSGKGYHLYVFLDSEETISNHNEHAALARAILGKMSALCAYDFESKVDICGGNMWVWHRKCENNDGFKLIHQGTTLTELPNNWRDHVKVVKTKNKKHPNNDINKLTSQKSFNQLDGEHKKLVTYLEETKAYWWWDADHNMLVTHTHWLQKASEDLNFRGNFQTSSNATNITEQNCFCFPMSNGAWSVRRYSKGVSEHSSWGQDNSGWTRTFLNKLPDLATASLLSGGLEDPKGGFIFKEGLMAEQAGHLMNIDIKLPPRLSARTTLLKPHKDGRLIVSIKKDSGDGDIEGWLNKNDKEFTKIFYSNNPLMSEDNEIGTYDDVVRSIVAGGEDLGWMINLDHKWVNMPYQKIIAALGSMGFNQKELKNVVGTSVLQSWRLTNEPFKPEYPGNRCWNKNAAQLRYKPKSDTTNLQYPHWNLVLDGCGRGLDESILQNRWCQENNIIKGGDYLKCWIASMFQQPEQPLPYLFFHGDQDSGKSTFHETIELLLTKGYQSAELALTNQSGHNGELEGAVLCYVEEVDLNKNTRAYNRIKDWVTSRFLNIRHMFQSPYHTQNTTHWVQCGNELSYVPLFPGDTRITVCRVEKPEKIIPKVQLLELLVKEAEDFITAVMTLELPPRNSRLNIPVIETSEKVQMQRTNETSLEQFVREQCVKTNGVSIKFSSFYNKFINSIDSEEVGAWTKRRVSKDLAQNYLKGRMQRDNQVHIGNLWWKYEDVPQKSCIRYTFNDPFLTEVLT